MSIAEWHEIFKIFFIIIAAVLVSAYALCTASEFVRNYKKMKTRARRYEKIMKMGGNTYVQF